MVQVEHKHIGLLILILNDRLIFYNKNDRLNKIRVFGLSLVFLGIVVLFWESFNNNFIEYLIGDALILISALILGARLVYVSHITQGINK